MKGCQNCKHKERNPTKEPCNSCFKYSNWKQDSKTKLSELKESVKNAIEQFPLFVNPCDVCKLKNRRNEQELKTCTSCCYYYGSKFEME